MGNRHDLLELKDRIQTSIEVCIQNFKRDLAIKRDRVYHDLDAKRWKCLDPQLNQQIVPQAMELLVKQLHLAKDELRVSHCSGSFMSIHGIPFYHTIRDLQQRQDQLHAVTSTITGTLRGQIDSPFYLLRQHQVPQSFHRMWW